MTLEEYIAKKKKKKEEEVAEKVTEKVTKTSGTPTLAEYVASKGKKTTDEGWLKKGLFADGYQSGDLIKTIIGSSGDISRNINKGMVDMIENAIDTTAYAVGGIGGLLGNDKLKEGAGKFVGLDLINEDEVVDSLGRKAPFSVIGNTSPVMNILTGTRDVEDASIWGNQADSLAQSGGQLVSTMALQSAGVPWWLTTGVTSFGGKTEEALNEGASYGKAGLSATITAGAEIISEKLSGGIKFGGKTLDDVMLKPFIDKISNKTVRTLVNLGVDATGEGFEEIFSSVADRLGSALYKEENIKDLLLSEEAMDEYLNSFIGGALLGGGVSSVNAAKSIQTGRDYKTGLTDNEQKVVDAEVQKRIEEQEKVEGTKVDKKGKTAIEQEVLEELKKGYITIDSIESTLGGDTYKNYQSILEKEAPLNTELDEIRNNKTLTDKQKKTLIEAIQGEIKTIGETSNKAQIREQLSKEVQEMVANSKDYFLLESYNERVKRGQEFEIDYTQYDEKQAEAIKTLIEGVKINNTRRVHEAVDYISKIAADKGVKVRLSDTQKLKEMGFEVEGKTINGLEHNGEVLVNIESKKALNAVTGHEITHLFEGTDYYDELKNTVIEYAKSKGEYNSRMMTLKKVYEKAYAQDADFDAKVERELVADIVGDYLFTDEQFISNLSTKQPNIFKKIYDEIKYMLKVATAGSEQARRLEKVKRAFDKAYKQSSNVDSDAKYALEDIAKMNEKRYNHHGWAKVNDVLTDIELADFQTKVGVKKNQRGKWYLDLGNGRQMFAVGEEGVNSTLIISDGKFNAPSIEKVYHIALNNETDIEIVRDVIYESEKNGGWTLSSGVIEEIYGNEIIGIYTANDFETFQQQSRKYEGTKSEGNIRLDTGLQDGRGSNTETQPAINEKASSEDGVFFDAKNTKFSLSEDTKGRILTKEQQEYFKDSKVVDENGSLKVMYHGTPNGEFTVFKDGTYFTENKEYADRYQSPSASSISSGKVASSPKTFEVYLNITKPFDLNDAEAREIYINEYIKGGNAIGINPYLSDAEYAKIDTIDWTEGEDLRDFLIDEGYDYDGLVLDEGADGGYGDEVQYRGKSYVVFNANQIKTVDNAAPTSDADIRYSLSEEVRPLEETDYNKLKNFFGVTNNYNVAGYMLTDGSMLDFSGRHWGEAYPTRQVDHRDVWDVWENSEKDGTQEMVNMISNGNIRLMPEDGGINLAVAPTESQRAVLEDYINHFKGEVIVDIDRVGGDTIETFTYDKGTPSSKILKDIDRYFKGGYVSDLMRFRMSLSDKNKDIAPTRGWQVYGDDIRLEEAPVKEEVVQDSPRLVQDTDYAPLTPLDAYIRDMEQESPIDESYMPDEVEAPYYESEGIEVESPFEERDIKDVGNRKVKAYMYENPEVKPFFQAEAQNMLFELQNSVKGEKHYNDQLYYDTNGEQGWFGTKRETSDDIAYLLDNFKYTYADIEKGLKAIIEDHGKENNAISKRIEFALNDRLKDGYTDFLSGYEIPANQDYINLLAEKQINTYSDEAYYEWLQSLANVELTEDIAPVKETKRNWDDVPISEGTQREFDYETGEVVDETEEATRKTHGEIQRGYVNNIKQKFTDAGYDFDKVLENAKNKSTFASVDNTPQRYIEKTLGYKEGQLLSDLTVNNEALNESKGVKWLNSFTNRKDGELAKLSKKYGIKPNSKEDAAAQMYAEGFYVNDNNEVIRYSDVELAMDFPDIDTQNRIKGLANEPRIRQIYDDTLTQINESRTRNGYEAIPRRENYFLHFRAMDDTFSRLGIPFNPNDIRAKDLPTDINGMTADLKPNQPYFASANQRKGLKTSHSLIGGMERYLTSAKNQIYHIEDIQTLRGLRNYIADMYGQAHGLENLDTLTEEEAEARIKEVYDAHLSTFAKFLNEQANVLAGKTSLIDRGLEGIIGRRGITTLNTINSQVAKNMVGFNVSSSMTNFVGAVQGLAKVNKFDAVKAFSQVVSNKINSIFGKSDGFAENDATLIRRKGAEKFYRTPVEVVSDVGYSLMSGVDNVTSEFLVRAKYNELTRKGMSDEQAHIEAGKWAMRILGDRSLGQQPQLYNSKMLGLITKFQLEVRNQLDAMFYDTIQEANVNTEDITKATERNAKKAAKITSTMVQLAVFQHLFGKAFESVAGYNPAFDIVSVLMTLLGMDDDEDSEDTFLDNTEQAFLELIGDLPYTSTFTGGRIPIESALPIEQLVTGKDDYGNEKSRWDTLKEAAPYWLNPFGGTNQIKKTMQGLNMFSDEHPVAGSYTDSGNLRFPVEETPLNVAQAALFGQWANENARDYFNNERAPLKSKQIEEFADLDIPIKDYWEYREGLSKQETLEDKFDYIADLDLPVAKKNIMINNVVDREEKVNLINYDDFSGLEEFDFATKNPEKYEFLQSINVSYDTYSASEDTKTAYNWAYKNPEKYLLSKVVGDVVTYRQYASELNDIKADKDSNGKSISGSRKEKVLNYINSLNADYGAKIILYKSEYASDNTYNNDIVEYLNGRNDISRSEMETILTELGFTVYPNGTVEW